MNQHKLKRSASFVTGLLIAFFGNMWLTQAMTQPTQTTKWIMVGVSVIVLLIIVYWNLDDKGNF